MNLIIWAGYRENSEDEYETGDYLEDEPFCDRHSLCQGRSQVHPCLPVVRCHPVGKRTATY